MKPEGPVHHTAAEERVLTGMVQQTYASREAYTEAVTAAFERAGYPTVPAVYDRAGNCLTCGEAGRCPGVHMVERAPEDPNAARGPGVH